MDYTCTSLVFHIERLQKRCQGLLKGTMSLSIWKWIQKYRPEKIFYERRISDFIVDETQIKVGHDHLWIWVAIEPKSKSILDIYLSAERTMFVAEHFLQNLISKYGKHQISTDGGVLGILMLVSSSK